MSIQNKDYVNTNNTGQNCDELALMIYKCWVVA